ncbi:MAG: serine hydrolase domain-containing protein [Pseudohaliea sp.]
MQLTDPGDVAMDASRLARIGDHLQQRYLEPGKIPGYLALVSRRDRVCYLDSGGFADRERATPVTEDTLFRIYSMTKPVVSLALMMLWERGLFALDDPVARYLPPFRDLRVRSGGAWPLFETRPCERPMRVRDLLMHTSGLTYDFLRESNVDYAYRKLQVGNPRPGYTLEDMISQLAELPLEFSPGERWNYSLATDVAGHLVEVLSGQPLPDFLQREVFDPLGMVDTNFNVRDDQLPRFASCYRREPDKTVVLHDDGQASAFRDRSFFSGGGGLLSTAGDYLRFCRMLLAGGVLDGRRIIGSRTLAFMTRNHLPDGGDLAQWASGGFSETSYAGVGFGLGFACKVDPVANGYPAPGGTFYWGGLASTLFWVDPAEELAVLFFTQLIPSSTFNFRGQLEQLVYAALE